MKSYIQNPIKILKSVKRLSKNIIQGMLANKYDITTTDKAEDDTSLEQKLKYLLS